jgi:glucokinase
MPKFAIGVDLGGTNLRIAAIDENGAIIEKVSTGTQVSRGRDSVIDEMTDAIRTQAMKFRDYELLGIGIGVPGIIDMQTGMLRESPNLPGWHNYPVRDEIEQRLGAKVILENDANAAALGEQWMGAAREFDDMCMITLGTGVGGGIVIGGRIWHGMRGMAGELGHMNIEPDGHPCGCGSRGCIEQLASATAIVRMARDVIRAGTAPQLARAAQDNLEFGAKVVYQMAVHGDPPAQEIYRKVGWALGIHIADLVNVFNFPIYVIGGGVASGWDAFSPALFDELRARSFVYVATAPADAERAPGRSTIVTRALLSGDAGLYGAARLPMLPREIEKHVIVRQKAS